MAAASFICLLLLLISFCSSPEANSSCNDSRFTYLLDLQDGGHFRVEYCDCDKKLKEWSIQLSHDDWYAMQENSSYRLFFRDEHHRDPKEDHLYNMTEPVNISDPSLFTCKSLEERRAPSKSKKHDSYCPWDDVSGPLYGVLYSITSKSLHGVDQNCSSSGQGKIFRWKILFNESGNLLLQSQGHSDRRGMCRQECFENHASRDYICMKRKGHDNKTSTAVGKGHDNNTSIAIGVGVGGGFVALLIGGLLLLYKHRKRKLRSSTILLSRTGSIDSSVSKEDPELGTYPELGVSRYRTYVFTFEELHEATGGFSESNELGDGGFGTVYKGVLRDGRVVAVKRLYQQNCRRLEQFMNEVDIISDLRHPNLVMLYGCTSRRSRDLLLVYEYVSNGTVADHLYGVQADAGFLTWPTRMSIAVQTADALAYLHDDGIQIIHRDVKTSNILLGDHFHVKVADFGLSRLFPADATHVSTAPQGTPGYLDPEYHQCYQLTDKSDVYSFGVVLAELISSKPAVDLTRQRSEINLSSMAINKILNQEMDQFVDPRLGYQSDLGTREMIDSVAELAFRCLQLESDMRPTMKEVLGVLRGIRSRGTGAETRGMDPDVEAKEDAHLLKNAPLYSPSSVVERWASVATTPNASG